jgi:hypothetical protein
MFHSSIAASIGIRVDAGKKETRAGLGGTEDVWVHPVQLFVGMEMFSIHAGFTDKIPLAGLLGRSGFFEYFKITFDPSTVPAELEIERVSRI